MTYRGRVQNGTVILQDPTGLPEGTEVRVSPLRPARGAAPKGNGAAKPVRKPALPTLEERLKPIIGKAETLPPDMSANHDHYLYGLPKQQTKRPPKRGGKRGSGGKSRRDSGRR